VVYERQLFLRRSYAHLDGRTIEVYQDARTWLVELRPRDPAATRTRWRTPSEDDAAAIVLGIIDTEQGWRRA
jgi:hypothetical protein